MRNISIVRLEAVHDCLLLLQQSDEISAELKEAVKGESHFAVMAEAVRLSEPLENEFLDECRAGWRQASDDEQLRSQLALALGHCILRGLDRQQEALSAQDALNADACLYRRYYADAQLSRPSEHAVRALFHVLRQRCTIELHTFVANTAAIDQWIHEMSVWDRSINDHIAQLAKAISEAEVEQPSGFYSPDDALLKLLARLRQGQAADQQELKSALSAEPSGAYARLVLAGYRELLAANAYLTTAAV